ncbi:MAG: hypothetical protein KAJ55_06710 [Anaerolineales bacterium]|nr:hypothetical protein [Anaerolineales bacterium]
MTFYGRRQNFYDGSSEYRDYLYELSRRSAMLDFLALYKLAAEEEIVGKIQFINQASGFSEYDPSGWEQYLTRLLGKCIRHHVPEPNAVSKQRRNMIYRVEYRYTMFEDLKQFHNLMTLETWPRPDNNLWREVNHNAPAYWKRTELFEGHEELFDALHMWWSVFYNSIQGLECIGLSPWYGIEVRYGTPMYRQYYRSSVGRYRTYEAYRDFKVLMNLWDSFLGHEDNVGLLWMMARFNHKTMEAGARITRAGVTRTEPTERDRRLQVLRDRLARHNRLVGSTPVVQDSEELRDQFMDRLRERRGE